MPTNRRTTAEEMAEDAALRGLEKAIAFLQGRSKDYKGARAAVRDVKAYTRLVSEQARSGCFALKSPRALVGTAKKGHLRRRAIGQRTRASHRDGSCG